MSAESEAHKVSVLMSLYKEDDELFRKCLQSLLDQTYKNWELILIDDGATESNLDVFHSFHDDRLTLHKNETNMGLTRSLNRAASFATGSLLARLDTDDFCVPHRFERQVAFMGEHPEVVLLGSQSVELHPSNEQSISGDIEWDDARIKNYLCLANPFVHSTLMIRRGPFEAISGYDETIRYAQDYDLVIRMGQMGKIHILKDALVERSLKPENISFSRRKEQMRYALASKKKARSLYGGGLRGVASILKTSIGLLLPVSLLNRRLKN